MGPGHGTPGPHRKGMDPMANVSLDHKIPQIGQPVGSRSEVLDLGIPSRNIASCSRPEEKENRGCPRWDQCDRAFRGERPQNEAVRMITGEGNVRVTVNPCFVNVKKELEADDKGMLIEVVAREGEKYTYRGSVKVDDKCPDCLRGECRRPHMYEDRDDLEAVVPTFPPAEEHPELVRFARMREARVGSSRNKKAALKQRLLPADEPGTGVKDRPGARA